MSRIVAGNQQILSQLNAARSRVNGSCSFRLFQDSVPLTPNVTVSDMVESSFAGYGRINTAGKFGMPFKVTDGLYQVDSSPFTVTPTADDDQLAKGWYIYLGSDVLYAASFPSPLPVVAGVPISVVVSLQEGTL